MPTSLEVVHPVLTDKAMANKSWRYKHINVAGYAYAQACLKAALLLMNRLTNVS
jgi:hypothetical protein